MFQLFEIRVRSRPRFSSVKSQAKQISFFCSSPSDSYRIFTTDSGVEPAGIATAAWANSGLAPTAIAAAPALFKNSRRLTSELDSQSGQMGLLIDMLRPP